MVERNFFKLGLLISLAIHFFLITFFPGFRATISESLHKPEYIEISLITVSPPRPKIVKKSLPPPPPVKQVEEKVVPKVSPVRIVTQPSEKTPILTPQLRSESEMKVSLPAAKIEPFLEKPQEPFSHRKEEGGVIRSTQRFPQATHLPPKSIYSTEGVVSYQKRQGKGEEEDPFSRIRGEVAMRGISRSPEPIYPSWAERQGIKANVELKFWVLSSGEVSSIEVFETSGWSGLDRLASEALSQWRFEPIKKNINQWGIITFRFQLD